MAGIYIHIPFCKQKCHYCNFYSSVSIKYRDIFVDALLNETIKKQPYLQNETIDTIYFGGGTPSMLSNNEINLILNTIYSNYNVSANAEITLEANPDDLSKKKLLELKNYTDINRLSIGVQSFFNDDLQYLNRVHNGNNAHNSIENALKLGFDNITIDLIYGIPTLTNSKWLANLNQFFDYKIPHLSSYSLTVEPKTALDVLIKKNKIQNINDSKSIKHFEILLNQTEKHKFINYEISNFAIEGHFSKHNSNYWLGKKYLGLGPSAHSYNGSSRQWNISNTKKYCENNNDIVEEIEELTTNQLFNEYVLTSIRTSWGCDIEYIDKQFGISFSKHFIANINAAIKEKKIIKTKNNYKLSNKGKLFADGIAASLFV